MKKEDIVEIYINIEKMKQEMIDRNSIIDDEYILKDLIESKTDIPTEEVEKMVDAILYLIKNDNYFINEIKNGIVEKVKKLLYVNDGVILNVNDMLAILNNDNLLIDNDTLAYKRDIVNGLEKENGKMQSLIVIPCTSNLQKHLFIEFELLTNGLLELPDYPEITSAYIDEIANTDIKITDIYID